MMVEVDLLDCICRTNDIELSLHSCKSLYIIPDRLETENGYLAETIKSLPYKIELLWSIKGDIFHTQYTLRRIAKHILYVYKKNELKTKTIQYVFDKEKSILQIVCNTIEFMLQVQHLLHYKKNIFTAMHEAYAIINKIQAHGHYLPNLSENKNEHKIGNVLLYLKYVNRIINAVGYTLLEPFDNYVEYPKSTDSKRPDTNLLLLSFDEFQEKICKQSTDSSS